MGTTGVGNGGTSRKVGVRRMASRIIVKETVQLTGDADNVGDNDSARIHSQKGHMSLSRSPPSLRGKQLSASARIRASHPLQHQQPFPTQGGHQVYGGVGESPNTSTCSTPSPSEIEAAWTPDGIVAISSENVCTLNGLLCLYTANYLP